MRRPAARPAVAFTAIAFAAIACAAAAGASAIEGGASTSGRPGGEPNGARFVAVRKQAAPGFELRRARAKPRLAFFDARQEPALRYRFRSAGPTDVRIELVKGRDGRLVRRWVNRDASPSVRHERSWRGTNRRGRAMPDGRYSFRIAAAGERTRRAASFEYRRHRFPVPSRHSYREGVGDFGAGRSGGRSHEGTDVWARCGAAIVAARGGRVERRGYDPRLYGHYLVIDARRTRADHFYVHLRSRPPVRRGERVRTGRRIGRAGRSGNARSIGCMLHFELWPLGFRRGKPVDPEPSLRTWDRWS